MATSKLFVFLGNFNSYEAPYAPFCFNMEDLQNLSFLSVFQEINLK